MKKIILFISLLVVIFSLIACDATNPAVVDDNPPINVNVSSGTISATVPTPLPISINGVTVNDGCVPSIPYYYQVADGKVTGHIPWSKLSFTPAMTTSESDIWSLGGTINFPATAQQMHVVSSNNVDDIGTVIFSGNSSGGSTTTLVDASKNFLGGTPVAIGDLLILDTTKEYGFITGVAATTLTCSGGFSFGGSGISQAYRVVDDSSTIGGHVVLIEYLDANFVTQWEFVVLNGTTNVNTTATGIYRVNSFRIVGTGSSKKATGNITLRNTADTVNFSYITAGYTRARNSAYTVPSGYTLFMAQLTYSFGYAANQTHYARIYGRATQNSNFRTDGIFYPFTEVICANTSATINLDLPSKFLEKVDIKVSGISTVTGSADAALRGWLETN